MLEALVGGLPVLCHDACGMGVAVDDASGLKVPLRDPRTSIAGFRAALMRLLNEPALLETLSQGAMKRAQELNWEEKIRHFCTAYHDALHG